MIRNHLKTALTELADDVAFHTVTIAHAVMDMTVLLVLGAAVFVSGLDRPAPMQAAQAPAHHQMATNCTLSLLADGCITQQILPQDS